MPIICGKLLSNAVCLYNATLYLKTSQKRRVIHAFNCEVLQGACTSQTPASGTGITSTPLTCGAGMRNAVKPDHLQFACIFYNVSSIHWLEEKKDPAMLSELQASQNFCIGKLSWVSTDLHIHLQTPSSWTWCLLYRHFIWACCLIQTSCLESDSFELPKEKGILKKKVL